MLGIYVDSGALREIELLLSSGIFRGVTTNPTLLRREGVKEADLPNFYARVVAAGAEEVFFQAWGSNETELIARARNLYAIGPKVVVKLVTSVAGTRAAASLSHRGFPVLLTAVYNSSQAIVGAAAGVKYVAPYLGRMGDAGRPAHSEIAVMARALRGVGSDTELLVASVRSPQDVVMLAVEGVSKFALAPSVARGFFNEPLTDAAALVFEEAASDMSN